MCDSKKVKCPRCGGSGKTEFSHVVEGVCFMCSGFGEVFPKRVVELTEKANVRKANKEAKRLAEAEVIELRRKEEENKYQEWQYNRNLDYFKVQSVVKTKGSERFMKTVLSLSKVILNEGSNESDVREMINDYLKSEAHNFRFQLSKWTLENYGFIFMEIDKDYDFQEGANIQNLYKIM